MNFCVSLKKSVNAQLLNFENPKLFLMCDREKIIVNTNFAVSRFNFNIPDILEDDVQKILIDITKKN